MDSLLLRGQTTRAVMLRYNRKLFSAESVRYYNLYSYSLLFIHILIYIILNYFNNISFYNHYYLYYITL